MRKILYFLFVILGLQTVNAQIGVGEWRDHLPFNYPIDVTQSSKKVYLASENGVFSYGKTTNHIEKFTKVNKLSDIGISTIEFSEGNNVLFIGYSNGNIDLIFDTEIINIPDIKREMINASKSINHVLFIDEYAYLSCGFGIVVLNIKKREIKDTYYIGDLGGLVQVNQLEFNDNYLYAATNQGIYIADYRNQNLIDYSNWQRIQEIPNSTGSFNSIFVSDNYILVNQNNESSNDILYSYSFQSGLWQVFNSEKSLVRGIVESASSIQILTNTSIAEYDLNLNFQDSISKAEIPILNPSDVEVGSDGTYWIACSGYGLLKYTNTNYEVIYPDAPYTSDAFSIEVSKDKVFVVPGGINQQWHNMYLNGAIYLFHKEKWTSNFNYDAWDYVSLAIDPQNSNHYYAGSWGKGVIEYRDNQVVEVYDDQNSTLKPQFDGTETFMVRDAKLDETGNLWITNSYVENPVSVKKPDGSWYSFNFDQEISNMIIGEILVSQSGHKWLTLPRGNGLFVFDENNTIENPNDDFYKKLNILDEYGKLISNTVYSIAEDLNGEIWVGTDQGIVVFYTPNDVFVDENFHANRIVVTIGEVTQYLLNTEVVTSIIIDGANRKWLGTQSSGVYLVSEDGKEEISHFTKENSPLLSNTINDIGVNHETGEVFFATDKGLISYGGSATMGSDEFNNVYVYPNPVRENYSGEITIRGLVSDVNIKITDISGNIVYETTAQGGQATWNGKNFTGRRVSTGVYLVFCTNEDGSKTHITKLLFIK